MPSLSHATDTSSNKALDDRTDKVSDLVRKGIEKIVMYISLGSIGIVALTFATIKYLKFDHLLHINKLYLYNFIVGVLHLLSGIVMLVLKRPGRTVEFPADDLITAYDSASGYATYEERLAAAEAIVKKDQETQPNTFSVSEFINDYITAIAGFIAVILTLFNLFPAIQGASFVNTGDSTSTSGISEVLYISASLVSKQILNYYVYFNGNRPNFTNSELVQQLANFQGPVGEGYFSGYAQLKYKQTKAFLQSTYVDRTRMKQAVVYEKIKLDNEKDKYQLTATDDSTDADVLRGWNLFFTDNGVPLNRLNYKLPLQLLSVSFSILTAFFHFIMALQYFPTFRNGLPFTNYLGMLTADFQWLRWLEYSITYTIMMVGLSNVSGVYDFVKIMSVLVMSVVTILFGLGGDYCRMKGVSLKWLFLIISTGFIPFVATFALIISGYKDAFDQS